MISMLSSLGDVPAEIAVCFATGNTAQMRNLDCGLIAGGRAGNLSCSTKPSTRPEKTCSTAFGSGDLPGIGMMIVDGVVSMQRSRNTPPATKAPEVARRM